MKKKEFKKISFIFLFCFLVIFIYLKLNPKKNSYQINQIKDEEANYSSNIIKGVNYSSKDIKGNEYIIKAAQGEIDLTNDNIIFLTNLSATIKVKDKEDVNISADYGKYNIINYDTIFTKNVKINYLDHKIISGYSDFSFERNSMIISKNVIYSNLENMLEADLMEIDINTMDIKISMYEQNKKVKVKTGN